MLTNSRCSWLLALFFAFVLVPSAARAQTQGTPALSSFTPLVSANAGHAAVASGEFGAGSHSGTSSVSSLGCCPNFFLPSSFTPLIPAPPLKEKHWHHWDHDNSVLAVPVYVPYAVGYDPNQDEDEADDSVEPPDEMNGAEFASMSDDAPPGPPATGHPATKARKPKKAIKDDGADSAAEKNGGSSSSDQPAEPVVPQPATVLVYKDGHKGTVENYAIVGDTLFDFADGKTRKILLADLDLTATEKANDAQGVDFKLPPENVATGATK